jgi:hypothetical protein
MQCLQDPNQSNIDNQYNSRREDIEHYRNKKKEYLKAKIYEMTGKFRDLYRGTLLTLRRIAVLELV